MMTYVKSVSPNKCINLLNRKTGELEKSGKNSKKLIAYDMLARDQIYAWMQMNDENRPKPESKYNNRRYGSRVWYV